MCCAWIKVLFHKLLTTDSHWWKLGLHCILFYKGYCQWGNGFLCQFYYGFVFRWLFNIGAVHLHFTASLHEEEQNTIKWLNRNPTSFRDNSRPPLILFSINKYGYIKWPAGRNIQHADLEISREIIDFYDDQLIRAETGVATAQCRFRLKVKGSYKALNCCLRH